MKNINLNIEVFDKINLNGHFYFVLTKTMQWKILHNYEATPDGLVCFMTPNNRLCFGMSKAAEINIPGLDSFYVFEASGHRELKKVNNNRNTQIKEAGLVLVIKDFFNTQITEPLNRVIKETDTIDGFYQSLKALYEKGEIVYFNRIPNNGVDFLSDFLEHLDFGEKLRLNLPDTSWEDISGIFEINNNSHCKTIGGYVPIVFRPAEVYSNKMLFNGNLLLIEVERDSKEDPIDFELEDESYDDMIMCQDGSFFPHKRFSINLNTGDYNIPAKSEYIRYAHNGLIVLQKGDFSVEDDFLIRRIHEESQSIPDFLNNYQKHKKNVNMAA